MSGKTIVIDLSALSLEYGGGVKSFSIDLCISLIKLYKKKHNKIIIFATDKFKN